MPQLDKLSFFSQYIYLVISFFFLYFFVLILFFPSLIRLFIFRGKLLDFFSEFSSYYFRHNANMGTFYQREAVLVILKRDFPQSERTELARLCANANRGRGVYDFTYFSLISTGTPNMNFLAKALKYKNLVRRFKKLLLTEQFRFTLNQIGIIRKFKCNLNFLAKYSRCYARINFVNASVLASNFVFNTNLPRSTNFEKLPKLIAELKRTVTKNNLIRCSTTN